MRTLDVLSKLPEYPMSAPAELKGCAAEERTIFSMSRRYSLGLVAKGMYN